MKTLIRTPRDNHGVVFAGNAFLVIGGEGLKKTEKCTLESVPGFSGRPVWFMNCREEFISLQNFYSYPELLPVHDDFRLENC